MSKATFVFRQSTNMVGKPTFACIDLESEQELASVPWDNDPTVRGDELAYELQAYADNVNDDDPDELPHSAWMELAAAAQRGAIKCTVSLLPE